jgi:CheY-like chemotaxis protein
MDGDRARCLEAGCDAYATKPVDLPSLIATMERLVPGAAQVA